MTLIGISKEAHLARFGHWIMVEVAIRIRRVSNAPSTSSGVLILKTPQRLGIIKIVL